jgi:hypothetical protein
MAAGTRSIAGPVPRGRPARTASVSPTTARPSRATPRHPTGTAEPSATAAADPSTAPALLLRGPASIACARLFRDARGFPVVSPPGATSTAVASSVTAVAGCWTAGASAPRRASSVETTSASTPTMPVRLPLPTRHHPSHRRPRYRPRPHRHLARPPRWPPFLRPESENAKDGWLAVTLGLQ